MAKPITTILFDLGGVLLQLNPERTGQAFAELGIDRFMDIWRNDTSKRSLYRLEVGAIDAAQFRAETRAALHTDLSDQAFDQAFCAMLGDIPADVLTWLEHLGARYDLYMLSNNNVFHLSHIERRYPKLRSLFRAAYFSQEIGHSKPEPASFHYVLKHAELDAGKTLFVDDSAANIEAAETCGLMGLLLPRNSCVRAAVDARLTAHQHGG